MNAVPGPPPAVRMFYDTGPLLCLGASEILRPSLDRHFRAGMRVVASVHAELRRQSTEVLPLGHAPSKQVRKRAALAGLRLYAAEMSASVARPDPVPEPLRVLESSMREAGEHQAKHRGECESIYHAKINGHGFVTNDAGAGRASANERLITLTFVDLNRRLLKINRQLNRDDVATELIRIRRHGIDTGAQIRSALDL